MEKLKTSAIQFIKIFEELSIPYAIIGGIAAGSWTEERFTKDIDFSVLIDKAGWKILKEKLENSSKIKINQIAEEQDYQMPYLVRLEFGQNVLIDLLISLTSFEKSLISRAVDVDLLGNKVKMATPEDIIVCKLIANRILDLGDIDKILRFCSDLDFGYIEEWSKIWGVEDRWKEILEKTKG